MRVHKGVVALGDSLPPVGDVVACLLEGDDVEVLGPMLRGAFEVLGEVDKAKVRVLWDRESLVSTVFNWVHSNINLNFLVDRVGLVSLEDMEGFGLTRGASRLGKEVLPLAMEEEGPVGRDLGRGLLSAAAKIVLWFTAVGLEEYGTIEGQGRDVVSRQVKVGEKIAAHVTCVANAVTAWWNGAVVVTDAAVATPLVCALVTSALVARYMAYSIVPGVSLLGVTGRAVAALLRAVPGLPSLPPAIGTTLAFLATFCAPLEELTKREMAEAARRAGVPDGAIESCRPPLEVLKEVIKTTPVPRVVYLV